MVVSTVCCFGEDGKVRESQCVCGCRAVCVVRIVSGLLLRDTGGDCSGAYLWGGRLGHDLRSLSSYLP